MAAGLIGAMMGNEENDDGDADGVGPRNPKGPKDDGDGSEAEETPRASQDGHCDKDFDEESTLSDDF